LCHHEELDAVPKPVEVKLKTDKETGLVTQRAQDRSDPDMVANENHLLSKGYYYDQDGVLRSPPPESKSFYGDHDLQGAYTRDPDGAFSDNPDDKYRPRPTNSQAFKDDINTTTGDRDMFQHGANDDYKKPDGSPGRLPGNNESFTVIDENGRATKVGPPTRELQDYYKSKGIPWPYPDYPIPEK